MLKLAISVSSTTPPTARRRSAHLSGSEAEFSEFSDMPRLRNLRLGVELLRLGVELLRLGEAMPRPSYSSSFVLSLVNSRIHYSFV